MIRFPKSVRPFAAPLCHGLHLSASLRYQKRSSSYGSNRLNSKESKEKEAIPDSEAKKGVEPNSDWVRDLNPEEVVQELDRHIIGQADAKKAVAIALRNRWRRQLLSPDLQKEVSPTNILLVGPTGSGKTEIARRLAKLAQAPFVRTEATRFTEVGIVGSDASEMIEELVDVSYQMEIEKARLKCAEAAKTRATHIIVNVLAEGSTTPRNILSQQVESGELDNHPIKMKMPRKSPSFGGSIFGAKGNVIDVKSITDFFGTVSEMTEQSSQTVPIGKARHRLTEDSYSRLIDEDAVEKKALERAEQNGIIFIDEIDKVAYNAERGSSTWQHKGEGVQKELLGLLEGTRINTKRGMVNTNHILFISAGAFHRSKPSDLLPELQGRLPIRVTLAPLKQADLVRILTEPDFNLILQTQEMLKTEQLTLKFTEDGINEIASMAYHMNETVDNIGARRLRTVISKVTEDVSFRAHAMKGQEIVIDAEFVKKTLDQFVQSRDLSLYVL